jgi:DNA-binding NtrC family response regulator
MGLSVVRGIVEQAGGYLEVASTPGVGTTFSVYLPALAVAADAHVEPSRAIAMGLETVLLVDDDEHVRRAASRALRARGFTVLEAPSGDRALKLVEEHPEIALLVTDVVMPGLDGRDLVIAARAMRPEIRTLYISGYTDDAIARHGAATGRIELLEKPFRLDCLAAKVRHVLDASRPLAA